MLRTFCTGSIVVMAILGFSILGCSPEKKQVTVQTQEEKVSYAIGLDIGKDIQNQSLGLDQELLIEGIKDGLSGNKPLIANQEIEQTRTNFLKTRQVGIENEQARIAEWNLQEGKAFLAENSAKDGVVTLPSGLQYKIIKPGTGISPKAEDNVKVHYRGYFLDGAEFENSYTQERPAVFPLKRVIPGWTEALQLMKEGAKWELFVPSDLAYGERGAGQKIGPNRTLIFEIELLDIH